MIAMRMKTIPLALVAATALMLAGATSAHAIEPTKFVPSLRFGENVDKTTHANVCLVSEASCGEGEESEQPGGFSYPGICRCRERRERVCLGSGESGRVQEFTADW